MSQGFPNGLGKWAVSAFAVGAVAGFVWALVRRHPPSAYRSALAEEIARRVESPSEDVFGGEEPFD